MIACLRRTLLLSTTLGTRRHYPTTTHWPDNCNRTTSILHTSATLNWHPVPHATWRTKKAHCTILKAIKRLEATTRTSGIPMYTCLNTHPAAKRWSSASTTRTTDASITTTPDRTSTTLTRRSRPNSACIVADLKNSGSKTTPFTKKSSATRP